MILPTLWKRVATEMLGAPSLARVAAADFSAKGGRPRHSTGSSFIRELLSGCFCSLP